MNTKVCLNCSSEKATELFVCYGGTGEARNKGICRACFIKEPKCVSKWYKNEMEERTKAKNVQKE